MNSHPTWFHRLPEILEQLALMPDVYLDRAACEALFDLRRSAAAAMLERMGAGRVGGSLAMSRINMMAKLRELQEHPDWTWRAESRRRVVDAVESARRETAARAVLIEQPAELEGRRFDDLPGVVFDPGRLTISHAGPRDLLAKLYALSQAIAADSDRFLEMKAERAGGAGAAE